MAIVPGSVSSDAQLNGWGACRFRRSRRGCEGHQRGQLTALQNRILMPRDFIWFVVRDRTTGAAVTDGYWSRHRRDQRRSISIPTPAASVRGPGPAPAR